MDVLTGGAPRKVLVRAVNWLGDAVMTTPALAALRAGCPGARITLLAKPLVGELFRGHPDVDEVMVYDRDGGHHGFRGKLRVASELRARRFDAAILLQNAFDAAAMTWLAECLMAASFSSRVPGLTLPQCL